MLHQKVGMPKVAYHRIYIGALDAIKRKNTQNKRQPFKFTRKKCNEIIPSTYTAQYNSIEAKTLSFVLRTASKNIIYC